MAREPTRVGLADMADAKCEDETIQRDLASRLDRVKKLTHRSLAITLALGEFRQALRITRGERENVIGLGDQAFGIELIDLLFAQAFDVEGQTRDEMLEPLFHLRLRKSDRRCSGARHRHGRFSDRFRERRPSRRQDIYPETYRAANSRPLLQNDADDLRDDVAGALQSHRVADANILSARSRPHYAMSHWRR